MVRTVGIVVICGCFVCIKAVYYTTKLNDMFACRAVGIFNSCNVIFDTQFAV